MASGFLSVQFGWTEVLLLVLAWYLLLRYWENSGKLDEWNASRIFFGMVLMVRTEKGKKSLEKVSSLANFGEHTVNYPFGFVGVQCLLLLWELFLQ